MKPMIRISDIPSRTRLSSTWVKNWLIVSVSLDSFVTRLPLGWRSKNDIDCRVM